MLTKGIIQSIDYNTNTCIIRMPIFETSGTRENMLAEATMIALPGVYGGYKVNDVVIIGFESEQYGQPIILGKLFLGNIEESKKEGGAVKCTDLSVSTLAVLPADTQIVYDKKSVEVKTQESTPINYNSLKEMAEAISLNHKQIKNILSAGETFSTSARMVGSWLDGSLVYQKTFYFVNSSSNQSSISIASLNFNQIWIDVGQSFYIDHDISKPLNTTIDLQNKCILLPTFIDPAAHGYVTIRYTVNQQYTSTVASLETPAPTLTGKILNWTAIEGATDYKIYKDTGLFATIAANSLTLTTSGSYTVQAIDNTSYYNPSEQSAPITCNIYTITPNIKNLIASTSNPTSIEANETLILTYTADGINYITPTTVPEIVGAVGTYTRISDTSCQLELTKATKEITFSLTGIATYAIQPTLTNCEADSSNPSSIKPNGTVNLIYYFDGTNYIAPSTGPTIIGATGSYTRTSDTECSITISNPTANVSFSLAGQVTGSFATDSWADIATKIKSGNDPYSIGDTKTDYIYHNTGTYSVVFKIIDDTVGRYATQSGTSHKVIEIQSVFYISDDDGDIAWCDKTSKGNTNADYTESALRDALLDEIYDMLPSALLAVLETTSVDDPAKEAYCTDRIFAPSYEEYKGTNCFTYYDGAAAAAFKKPIVGETSGGDPYWLRTASYDSSDWEVNAYCVGKTGGVGSTTAWVYESSSSVYIVRKCACVCFAW